MKPIKDARIISSENKINAVSFSLSKNVDLTFDFSKGSLLSCFLPNFSGKRELITAFEYSIKHKQRTNHVAITFELEGEKAFEIK